jgi:hypothetical protein
LLVVEAQNMETTTFKRLGPQSIMLLPLIMRRAVQLDDQARFATNEIGEVAVDRDLAAKLEAREAAASDDRPELLFRRSLAAAQATGIGDRVHVEIMNSTITRIKESNARFSETP